MKNRVSQSLRGLGCALILGLAASVQAAPWPDRQASGRISETHTVESLMTDAAAPEPANRLAQANGQISLNQAVAQVQRRTGGRVLSAETQSDNGSTVHVIRVLVDNQRVRTIRVDARTGEWL
jgi:uncharacterized membrane protein YkoI